MMKSTREEKEKIKEDVMAERKDSEGDLSEQRENDDWMLIKTSLLEKG